MTKASDFLTAEERGAVEAAIHEAERKTSGEIVVVLATRSGRYARGEDLCGICLGLLAVSAGWFLWQGVSPVSEAWGSGWRPTLGLAGVIALFLVGFWVGQSVAQCLPLLARMFVPKQLMQAELEDKAAQAFHRFRIRRTAAATGVLIYLSIFERLVWIVGDETVAAQVDPTAWDEIRDVVIAAIRADRAGEGLVSAVRRSGELLAEHLPADAENPNELTNTVFLLD